MTAVDLSGLDLDAIAANITMTEGVKREDLVTVYQWIASQQASEAAVLEALKDTVCPKLKGFLPYNKNMVFSAKAITTWLEGNSEAGLKDLESIRSAIARSWQPKYVNASRSAVMPVLAAGQDTETTVEALKSLCPERDLNADDIVKYLSGKQALPAAAEFIAGGGDLSAVEQKNEQKYLDSLLTMQAVLEAAGATVTWPSNP